MAFDFRARQVRVNQIINSGSTATSPLLVYGVGAATDLQGGTNSLHFPGLGSDVWLYVSGTRDVADQAYGVVAFRGDVVVSGALQIGDSVGAPGTPASGKGVIFARTGSLYFKDSLGNESDLTAGGVAPSVTGTWNELSPSPRLNTTASVAIAGGLGSSYAAQDAGSDVFLFVSGTDTNRVSLFGGQIVSSGSIRIKGASGASSFIANVAGVISGSGNAEFGGTLTVGSTANVFGNVNVRSPIGAILATMTTSGVISGSSDLQVGGSAIVAGSSLLNGDVTLGDSISDNIYVSGSIISDILPKADSVFNLGSPVKRWANIYTGDLHLRNDRGDWTIIEEDSFLRVVNNKTGKSFRMMMEPID